MAFYYLDVFWWWLCFSLSFVSNSLSLSLLPLLLLSLSIPLSLSLSLYLSLSLSPFPSYYQDEELKTPFLSDSGEAAHADIEDQSSRFHSYISGIVPVIQQSTLERMVFRISRGNAYVRFFPIAEPVADPLTGEMIQKSVFYIVYLGQIMQRRLMRMCDHARATRYEVPQGADAQRAEMDLIDRQINEAESVLNATLESIRSILGQLSLDLGRSPLRNWQESLRREKHICDALKKCQIRESSRIVIAEGWCPVSMVDQIHLAVRQAVRFSGAQPAIVQEISSDESPPTFFQLNKFTSVFQGIVNTYGVPRYKEVNPGLFTIVTFPFLFGVMYGDIGHGTFLFLASLYIILKEGDLLEKARRKELGEIQSIIFNGRYLLVCMGFFAIYAGTIYNDCLSIPLNVFGSHWRPMSEAEQEVNQNDQVSNGTLIWDGGVYPYGMDPHWYHTKNELTFFNSLKMKMSVIIGVIQMTFGICLGLFNHTYFKDRISIFMEWLPQLLFMTCTFGYMIFLVVFKMTVNWNHETSPGPPNLIQTMITMFLSLGGVDGEELYAGQKTIQQILIFTTVLSMPWMLLGKPYTMKFFHNRRRAQRQAMASPQERMRLTVDSPKRGINSPRIGGVDSPQLGRFNDDDSKSDIMSSYDDYYSASEAPSEAPTEAEEHHGGGGGHGHAVDPDGEFPMSEFMIHQSIHTIEFILGAVSNTASYLRLWALSLAHAELASVFWTKLVIEYGVESGNPVLTFAAWGAWAGATFAVLLCMDVLECFLHALRLHWVEFQNKFYNADGYAFKPFTFEIVDED